MRSAQADERTERAARVSRTLLVAQSVSEAGDFIGLAALLLYAYGRSGNVLGPAAVFAVKAVPALLVGTVWSGWLGRPERRRALVLLALVGAVVVGAVAAAPSLALALVASAVLQGSRNASFSLQAAVVVDQMPADRRGRFFATSSVINQSTQVLGYVVGAAITTAVGARSALSVDAATFLVGAAVLSRLPRIQPAPGAGRPPAGRGLQTMLTQPVLRIVTPIVWLGVLGAMLPETLAPRIAHGTGLAIVMAAMPAGGLCTSLLADRTGVLDRIRRQLATAAAFGAAFALGALALALHAGWGVIAVANAAVGAASVWVIGARTTFSRYTPPEQIAQVEATMVSSITVLSGGGTIALAAVALVSLPAAYGLAGIPLLLLALASFGRERRLSDAGVLEPASADSP